MKYIIVKKEGVEVGVVFGDFLSHREAARIHNTRDVVLVSAGFCDMDRNYDSPWRTWGQSESLGGMKSRPEDATVLNRSVI